jgi:hypothetical protein
MGDRKDAFGVLVGRPHGKKPLGKHSVNEMIILK